MAPKYILEQFLEAELLVNITEHQVTECIIFFLQSLSFVDLSFRLFPKSLSSAVLPVSHRYNVFHFMIFFCLLVGLFLKSVDKLCDFGRDRPWNKKHQFELGYGCVNARGSHVSSSYNPTLHWSLASAWFALCECFLAKIVLTGLSLLQMHELLRLQYFIISDVLCGTQLIVAYCFAGCVIFPKFSVGYSLSDSRFCTQGPHFTRIRKPPLNLPLKMAEWQ